LPSTAAADLSRFFGAGTFRHVVAIESAWFERARSTPLWLYEMPAQLFSCVDSNAGYHVSEQVVRPLSVHRVAEPLAQFGERSVELRVVSNLWTLVEAVVGSSVAFSCIRMRNALPPGAVPHNPSVAAEVGVDADHGGHVSALGERHAGGVEEADALEA